MEDSKKFLFISIMFLLLSFVIFIIPLIIRKHKCYDKEKNKAIFISIANSLISFLIFLCFETIINSYSALKYYAVEDFIAIFVCYRYLTNKTDIEIRKDELRKSYKAERETNTDTIENYHLNTNFSKEVCTDLYYIEKNFKSNNNEIAYSLIKNKLIKDLKNNKDNIDEAFMFLSKYLKPEEIEKYKNIKKED